MAASSESSSEGPGTRVGCPLCAADGGDLVFRCADFRVIRPDEPAWPAFYRLVWNSHVAEFSDLTARQRLLCVEALTLMEQALRAHLRPRKVNLASLGNQVPHLHWHVVAREEWDPTFPGSPWSPPVRDADPSRASSLVGPRLAAEAAMRTELAVLTAS